MQAGSHQPPAKRRRRRRQGEDDDLNRPRRKLTTAEADQALLRALGELEPHRMSFGLKGHVWSQAAERMQEASSKEVKPKAAASRFSWLVTKYRKGGLEDEETKRLMEEILADQRAFEEEQKDTKAQSKMYGKKLEVASETEAAYAMETSVLDCFEGKPPKWAILQATIGSLAGRFDEISSRWEQYDKEQRTLQKREGRLQVEKDVEVKTTGEAVDGIHRNEDFDLDRIKQKVKQLCTRTYDHQVEMIQIERDYIGLRDREVMGVIKQTLSSQAEASLEAIAAKYQNDVLDIHERLLAAERTLHTQTALNRRIASVRDQLTEVSSVQEALSSVVTTQRELDDAFNAYKKKPQMKTRSNPQTPRSLQKTRARLQKLQVEANELQLKWSDSSELLSTCTAPTSTECSHTSDPDSRRELDELRWELQREREERPR